MFITKENAAAMSKKGNDARKAQLEELRVALTALSASSSDEYKARRIARVRRQIDKLDTWILDASDAQQISWIAGALERLTKIERELRGEALPAPVKQETRKRLAMIDVQPSLPADPTFTPQPSVSPETPQEPASGAEDIVGL